MSSKGEHLTVGHEQIIVLVVVSRLWTNNSIAFGTIISNFQRSREGYNFSSNYTIAIHIGVVHLYKKQT